MNARSVLVVVGMALASCAPKKEVERDQSAPPPDSPALSAAPTQPRSDLERYTSDLKGSGPLQAILVTSVGRLECVLHTEEAPLTVANFVGLARGEREWIDPETGATRDDPLYEDLPFHRIIGGFAAQTGSPTGDPDGGPGYFLPDEFHPDLKHDRPGVLSMVNHGPNTGGSQFFILLSRADHLDGRHTVFGRCEENDALQKLAEADDSDEDAPPVLERVVIRYANGE